MAGFQFEYVIIGILGLLIHLFLSLGAALRNSALISGYIVLALIYNIINFVVMCWAFNDEVKRYQEMTW